MPSRPAALTVDALIAGPLTDLRRAAETLRREAARTLAASTRGSPEWSEAWRINRAADELLLQSVARPLLEAQTRRQKARDAATGDATTAELQRVGAH